MKLNYPNPVPDDAAARLPVLHPVYGRVFQEIPIAAGTPWTDPDFGWQLVVTGRDNDGRTLLLEAQRPAHLGPA